MKICRVSILQEKVYLILDLTPFSKGGRGDKREKYAQEHELYALEIKLCGIVNIGPLTFINHC